ncbi:hypothetical protein GP486_005925 [Trichoglossum hirsutum]|uniref:Aminoglycoside phosphotransferase domain-containing protein n=1 Tax=Trichoglossum hirsutum TaxID=265104 RepID=A0A9P8L8A1_9PEZI|nr:hypothetical protein GP486_005925 [Trichoglossum hirsutum]
MAGHSNLQRSNMDFDDIVLLQRDSDRYAWNEKGARSIPAVCNLASQIRNSRPCHVVNLSCGSFNFCFKVLFPDDNVQWMVRFPIPGKAMFPEEKLRGEVATMGFIKKMTSIPVPTVVAFGTADDDTTGLGPFIITEFIEGRLLKDVLGVRLDNGDRILRPDINDDTLKVVYRQIADIMLELWKHDFDLIGALSPDGDSWSIKSRPITLKMNEIARCGNVFAGHPEPFSTAKEYLLELANQNMLHLEKQRNSTEDEEDAQRKYIFRRLFLSATRYLISPSHDNGPFKLFCDDFCPGNILVDSTLKITSVIDWEYTYAAPVQFLSAPWRSLLLLQPAAWDSDHDKLFRSKFELFLGVLKEQEETVCPNRLSLSTLMQQSADDMTFWYNEAARDSFSFEDIYWPRLDRFFFNDGVERRIFMSREGIQNGLAEFVNSKMEQLQQYTTELEEQKKKDSALHVATTH